MSPFRELHVFASLTTLMTSTIISHRASLDETHRGRVMIIYQQSSLISLSASISLGFAKMKAIVFFFFFFNVFGLFLYVRALSNVVSALATATLESRRRSVEPPSELTSTNTPYSSVKHPSQSKIRKKEGEEED